MTARPSLRLAPEAARATGLVGRLKLAVSSALAVVFGLAPHVLHHAGPLAGAALVSGAIGSVLFGLLGLVVALPFLLRLHRRSGGWRTPGAVLVLMVAAFSLSTFVVGPAVSGENDTSTETQTQPAGHSSHHP